MDRREIVLKSGPETCLTETGGTLAASQCIFSRKKDNGRLFLLVFFSLSFKSPGLTQAQILILRENSDCFGLNL